MTSLQMRWYSIPKQRVKGKMLELHVNDDNENELSNSSYVEEYLDEETEEYSNECEGNELSHGESEVFESCTKTIYTWGYDQTVALIHSMDTHFNDLNHPKKRKHVFKLVANDLNRSGFDVDNIMVQNKWKSLTKSYRKAKEAKKRTGQAPARFLFYNLMDDILGNTPINACESVNPMKTIRTSVEVKEEIESPNATEFSENSAKQNVTQKKLSEKRLRENYIRCIEMERQKRQKRHEERLEIEKAKIRIEEKKLELLEKYLKKEK